MLSRSAQHTYGATRSPAWNADLWSAQRPVGPRAVHRRPISRDAGTGRAALCGISATPMYGSRRTLGFPPRSNHLGTEGPSRRPPTAGCAGLKTGVPSRPRAPAPAAMRGFRCRASPALLRATPGGAPSRRSGSVPPPACGGLCRPEAGVPSRPRAPAPAAMRGFRCRASPALLRATPRREPSRTAGSVRPPACGGRAGRRPALQAVPARSSGGDARFPLSHVTCAAAGYPPAIHPPSGRSNQTCTCPVPTAFSYSENIRPGAVHSAPPAALTAIR